MNILLEIYLFSGALVGLFEGLFLQRTAKRLYKAKSMKSMEDATRSVVIGVIIISITPILNTLHLLVKTQRIFSKK